MFRTRRFHLTERKDLIPGGLADKSDPSEFDQNQLAMGAKVEREHTNSDARAREIAMDHLKEDPRYYTKLKTIERHHESDDGKKSSAGVDSKVNPLALLARERAKADEKEGHDAADYWRGWAAGSFLTGNDNGLGRTPLRTIKSHLRKG